MYGLCDCNNFFASCERVFNPSLIGQPVVVLSNNDGCVIARSNEAKILGVNMGVPVYQIKRQIEEYNIAAFSSNYTLYQDMSNRVMYILSSFAPELETYSIDEAFLNFKGFDNYDLKKYGEKIVRTVTKGTGIPVSLGIAPTKTLSKVANKFSKKYNRYNGCCVIDTEEKRIKALSLTDLSDIWGVGGQYEKLLSGMGIKNAYEFSTMPQLWVRKNMTVVGEDMWKELNGIPCFNMDIEFKPKKSIRTSRTFGNYVNDIEGLRESITLYASLCAEKLRKQNSCAKSLILSIRTNQFNEKTPQYSRKLKINLPIATSSTPEIVHYALEGLRSIYRSGFSYKKAGVTLIDIIPNKAIQTNLFDKVDRYKHNRLMLVVDQLNSGFTKNNLILASQAGKREWKLKREKLSPNYTTNIKEIIRIK